MVRTYPNEIAFGRTIHPDEVGPIQITLSRLVSTDTNELVSVLRYPIEDERVGTDLTGTCTLLQNIVSIPAVFGSSEKNRPNGIYRLEIKGKKSDSARVEVSNLIIKVER